MNRFLIASAAGLAVIAAPAVATTITNAKPAAAHSKTQKLAAKAQKRAAKRQSAAAESK